MLDALKKKQIERLLKRIEAPWENLAALRDRARPLDSGRWFLAEEIPLVSALAATLLPSDDRGPGAAEANIASLLEDMLVAASPQKRRSYSRGLLSIEEWARRVYGRPLAELPHESRAALITAIEAESAAASGSNSLVVRIKRKLKTLNQRRTGLFPAIPFLPLLLRDVMRLFYTSHVAWQWLGYDGPPMPRGYDDLIEPRPTQQKP